MAWRAKKRRAMKGKSEATKSIALTRKGKARPSQDLQWRSTELKRTEKTKLKRRKTTWRK